MSKAQKPKTQSSMVLLTKQQMGKLLHSHGKIKAKRLLAQAKSHEKEKCMSMAVLAEAVETIYSTELRANFMGVEANEHLHGQADDDVVFEVPAAEAKAARFTPYETKSARTIQTFFKAHQDKVTPRIVAACINQINIEKVKSISFEALVVFLREKHIIKVSKDALQRIHILCCNRHGTPSKTLADPSSINVRVFLAAYMIAYRPTHVFESMGSLEQALLESAIPLLEAYDKICRSILSEGCFAKTPSSITANFTTLLFEYLKRFKAWKVPDEEKLAMRLKHALVALYIACDKFPPSEPADSKLRLEFTAQIGRLRSKLQQIAGKDALAKFDEGRLSGSVSIDINVGANQQPPDAGAGAYAALPGRMSNEQLAHELLLNPAFQLDEHGGCSAENPVFHSIRDSFHRAFWTSLVEDLKLQRPCYTRVMRVIGEVKDGLADLAGSMSDVDMNQTVDIEHIKRQAEMGLFTWANCRGLISAIVEVIKRVQRPRRDTQTNELWAATAKAMENATPDEQPQQLINALEFLLERVNVMRIDAANARLRLISPVVAEHGISYEQGKFKGKLNDGSLTLDRTMVLLMDCFVSSIFFLLFVWATVFDTDLL